MLFGNLMKVQLRIAQSHLDGLEYTLQQSCPNTSSPAKFLGRGLAHQGRRNELWQRNLSRTHLVVINIRDRIRNRAQQA